MNEPAIINKAELAEPTNMRNHSRQPSAARQTAAPGTGAVRSWRALPYVMTIAASILLLLSLKLPLWRMHLEAPQYRGEEALNVAVHPDRLQGDLQELTTLDQYIGVHVPKTLPQFKWLPSLLGIGAALGLVAVFLPGAWRRLALAGVTCGLVLGLSSAAVQATTQIRDIGHKRDQKTVLAGIKDFTPPFLGTSKIAQFTVRSRFGLGAWLIGAALALQAGAAWKSRSAKVCSQPGSIPSLDNSPSPIAALSR